MININPSKSFRVLVRTSAEYKRVVDKAVGWGFDWFGPAPKEEKAFAIIFRPDHEAGRRIHRQMSKYMPGTQRIAYGGIKKYTFDQFINSSLKYKKRVRRTETGYAVVATCRETNNEFEFKDATAAVQWLRCECGKEKAVRQGIYLAVSKNTKRSNFAYGYEWRKAG